MVMLDVIVFVKLFDTQTKKNVDIWKQYEGECDLSSRILSFICCDAYMMQY